VSLKQKLDKVLLFEPRQLEETRRGKEAIILETLTTQHKFTFRCVGHAIYGTDGQRIIQYAGGKWTVSDGNRSQSGDNILAMIGK